LRIILPIAVVSRFLEWITASRLESGNKGERYASTEQFRLLRSMITKLLKIQKSDWAVNGGYPRAQPLFMVSIPMEAIIRTR
jgi:hypothetical protein